MSRMPIRLTVNPMSPHTYKAAEKALILITINGAYRFDSVPPEIHEGFMAAANKQDYFDRHINGKFKMRPAGMY